MGSAHDGRPCGARCRTRRHAWADPRWRDRVAHADAPRRGRLRHCQGATATSRSSGCAARLTSGEFPAAPALGSVAVNGVAVKAMRTVRGEVAEPIERPRRAGPATGSRRARSSPDRSSSTSPTPRPTCSASKATSRRDWEERDPRDRRPSTPRVHPRSGHRHLDVRRRAARTRHSGRLPQRRRSQLRDRCPWPCLPQPATPSRPTAACRGSPVRPCSAHAASPAESPAAVLARGPASVRSRGRAVAADRLRDRCPRDRERWRGASALPCGSRPRASGPSHPAR